MMKNMTKVTRLAQFPLVPCAILTSALLLTGCVQAVANPSQDNHLTPASPCDPGWFDNRGDGPMPLIRCIDDFDFQIDHIIEAEPELINPGSPQLLTPEEAAQMFRDAGWTDSPQPSEAMLALMRQIDPLGVGTDFAQPVWQAETQTLEFWMGADVDPAPIFAAAEEHGVAASDIAIMRRKFSMAELLRAREVIWAEGVNGIKVNAISIPYDGSGIEVGLTEPFDKPLDEPITYIYGVPIDSPWGHIQIRPIR